MCAVKIVHSVEDGVDVTLRKNGLGTRGKRNERLAVQLHGMMWCVCVCACILHAVYVCDAV